jgi:hypothetical protein
VAADDYTWFTDEMALRLNFCLTYVRGVGPDEALRRLGGTDSVELRSAELVDRASGELGGDLSLVAAAAIGEWTVLFEPNHFLATFGGVIRALSGRGELVSFYYNQNTSPLCT